ncbi:MAG: 30S ribosome-binding factor RbfA [Planctomycetota bacterium]|jgi:ribosome-binding factor A
MRGYRKERVASLVHEIVSEAILQRINDPRVSPLTTVTRVQISGDLTIATVYLSVLDDPAVERRTITALRHAGGFIQRMVAKGLDMRQCPELRFEVDEQLKKVKHTLQLLNENRRNLPDLAAAEEGAAAVTDAEVESDPADLELDEAELDDTEERDG